MKNILVTGGAGYIGSVAVKRLLDTGYTVTIVDNLKKGKKEYVDKRAIFYKTDILNLPILKKKLENKKFDIIMHFAALKDAGESMVNMDLYQDNIRGIMNLLQIAPKLKVKKIIFSSSAMIYGESQSGSIDESYTVNPTNFYGYTKLAGEHLLEWNKKINNIEYIILRYFNVAGDGGLNYIAPKANNIFDVICEILSKRKKNLNIFGNDYDTTDGTCIRDYIHINDLVDAHLKACKLKGSHIINLGSEKGYSVLEIVKEFEKVSGKKIHYKITKRRVGDVTSLIASSLKAKNILKWNPKLELKNMVESTWKSYSKRNEKK